jgi:tetratricopeptide (TPR) repeat protein
MNKCLLLAIMLMTACQSSSDSKRINSEHKPYNAVDDTISKELSVNNFYSRKKIDSLIKIDKIGQAEKVVDSLIKSNPKNGYAYFEKGFFNEYNKNFPIAIMYYLKAKDLNYRKAKCDEQIAWCNEVMKMLEQLNKGNGK